MLKVKSIQRNRVNFESYEKVKNNYYNSDIPFSFEHVDGGYKLFAKETSMKDVFTYGDIQLKDDYDHNAGYVWSSRVGCLNKQFGTRFIEVSINNGIYAMDIDKVKEIVEEQTGDKYNIVEELKFEDNEPYYSLMKEEE